MEFQALERQCGLASSQTESDQHPGPVQKKDLRHENIRAMVDIQELNTFQN